MCDPSEYQQVYEATKEAMKTYGEVNAVCQHTFHKYRFNVDRIKKLNKLNTFLNNTKESIEKELEKIDEAFQSIETFSIIYLHNLKKVQDELLTLVDVNEKTEDEKVIDEVNKIEETSDEIYTFKKSDIDIDSSEEDDTYLYCKKCGASHKGTKKEKCINCRIKEYSDSEDEVAEAVKTIL